MCFCISFCWVRLNVLKIFRNLLDAGFYFIFFFPRTFCYPTYEDAPPQCPIPYPFIYYSWQITVEPLLWDISIQVTPPFRGHKIWSRKNVHIVSVFVTSIKGKPLLRGRATFLGSKPWFHLHSGDTLAIKKLMTTKIVVCSQVTMETDYKTWINSLKSMSCT